MTAYNQIEWGEINSKEAWIHTTSTSIGSQIFLRSTLGSYYPKTSKKIWSWVAHTKTFSSVWEIVVVIYDSVVPVCAAWIIRTSKSTKVLWVCLSLYEVFTSGSADMSRLWVQDCNTSIPSPIRSILLTWRRTSSISIGRRHSRGITSRWTSMPQSTITSKFPERPITQYLIFTNLSKSSLLLHLEPSVDTMSYSNYSKNGIRCLWSWENSWRDRCTSGELKSPIFW